MPVTHVPVSVPDAATYTVLADNSGVVHYLPNLTADIVITLPTPRAGLWFEFCYAGVAADAQDWLIDTGSNTNFYIGGLIHLDTDAVAAGIEVVAIAPDGNSNSKLTVLTPTVGTSVRVESANGTTWNVRGFVASIVAPSFADQ